MRTLRGVTQAAASLALLTAFAACNIFDPVDKVSNSDFEVEEPFSYTLAATDLLKFRIEAVNGSIIITGSADADSVEITGMRKVGSESIEDAREHLDNLEVRVSEQANEIFVRTIQPQKTVGRNYIVDYTVVLPNHLRIDVGHVNGTIRIAAINNRVSVNHVNGPVLLDQIVGNAHAAVVNGQIQADVTLPLDGIIVLSTVNGAIDLDIPQDASAEISANVTNGAIRVSGLELKSEVRSPNSLRATVGDGQGTITLTTVNGNIILSGK